MCAGDQTGWIAAELDWRALPDESLNHTIDLDERRGRLPQSIRQFKLEITLQKRVL